MYHDGVPILSDKQRKPMARWLVAAALSVSFLLSAIATGTAEAGSPGARSYSSGRSTSFGSSGRSYSAGSSPSGRSFSGAGSPSGRSYSSGSSKPATGYGRPSSAPGRNTFPSRSNPSPSAKKMAPSGPPPSTNPDRPATGSGRGTTSKSDVSPAKTYSSGTRPGAGETPTGNGSPEGRRYSSGNASLSGKSYTAKNGSKQAPTGSFDASAGRSQKMAESKVVYLQGRQPKSSYTDRGGVSHPIDPKDRTIETLRKELDYQRWQNRQLRQREFFGRYYTNPPPPVVVYHDPYSTFFWWWLLERSLDERAYWAYHHRQAMDDARYRDLLARDANLEGRIRQLEAEHVPRDPTYRPGNIDPDLMYSTSYVDAAYNPQPRVTTEDSFPSGTVGLPASPRRAFRAMLMVFAVLAGFVFIIWLVFYKRWGGTGD